MTHSYGIWPLRFSPDPAAMIEFYRRIGLHESLSLDGGGFGTFTGRSGALGVHDARDTASGSVPLHTALNLTTHDVEAAAAELVGLGHDVKVWDETYGKQGVVLARDGRAIGLNGSHQEDLYGGFRTHEPDGVPLLDVVAVSSTPEMKAEAAWFASFGFVAGSYDDPWWIGLRAGERSGVIGIHAGEVASRRARPDDDLFGPAYEVRLGFESTVPLEELRERLRSAGVDATLVREDAPHLELVDPDGEPLQIHPAGPGAGA